MSNSSNDLNFQVEDINNENPDNFGDEEPAYIIRLEMENGKEEHIKIYSDSDPAQLAEEFCKEHGLEQEFYETLAQKIEDLLQSGEQENMQMEEEGEENEERNIRNQNDFIYGTNDTDMNQHDDNDSLRYSDNRETEENRGQTNAIIEANNNEEGEGEEQLNEEKEKGKEFENKVNEEEIKKKYEDSKKFEENAKNINNNNIILNNLPYVKEKTKEDQKEKKKNEVPIQHSKKLVNIETKLQFNNNEEIKDIKNPNDYIENYRHELSDENNEQNLNQPNNKKIQFNIINKNNKTESQISQSIETANFNKNMQISQVSENPKEETKKCSTQIENPQQNSTSKNPQSNIRISNKPLSYPYTNPNSIKNNNTLSLEHKENTSKNKSNELNNKGINEYLKPKYSSNRNTPSAQIQHNNPHINSNNNKNSLATPISFNRSPSSDFNNINNHDIFDRLFKNAEMKRLRPCHFSNSNFLNNSKPTENFQHKKKGSRIYNEDGNPINYGEYLYQREMVKKGEREKQFELIKKEQKELEKIQCTFKPCVNDYNFNSFKENSNQQTSEIKKKVSNVPQCSYSVPSSNRLRIDQKKKENLKKEYNEMCTFHPHINPSYPQKLSFKERPTNFFKLFERRRKDKEKEYTNKKNNNNNNNNYQPVLISKKFTKKDDNKEDVDVFNKNYNYLFKYKKNKEEELPKKIDQFYSKNFSNRQPYKLAGQNKTGEIISRVNTETFSLLFKELDSNDDNLITPLSFSTKKLNKNVLRIIQPLLNELKEDNQTLNEEEFVSAMYQLYNQIPLSDKHILTKIYKPKRFEEYPKRSNSKDNKGNMSYKPIINRNASRLAKNYCNRMEILMNSYLNGNKSQSGSCGNISKKEKGISKKEYFKSDPFKNLNNCNNNFSIISNITFNNYLKNLN